MRGFCITLMLSLVPMAALAQPAVSGQTPETLSKVYACAEITDGPARLACYDQAVGAMQSAQKQGAFTAVDAAQVQQLERESFGFRLPSLPRLSLPSLGGDDAVEAIAVTTTIASVRTFGGKPAYVLANGQTWAVIDSDTNSNARPGREITIKQAAQSSFLMSVKAGGTALRVRRIE
jgi:hypothetical protein